ncbi:hypothetical protein SDRG_09162 [Saprolegnia diclina VS20]|uniref:BZIP domain-containing protein n=1 Tax=Saprolegnia diclina (strain VS20) TaxID=1156394 RepID=T0RSL5_SAPDV|nr:hypothetical protein SDRG_09162 [Saprolegnia diclina VS20]EQC33177.1 hypothetical protein SDRG_09162 [Saprolegnia diclina VS20]|eukprot:XP_008613300.1 hypothetical protein SDRG_09162 [Saprolegnia diclina VS20]
MDAERDAVRAAAKLRRRLYQRQKQRQYRSRESSEVASLRALVAELEVQVDALTTELRANAPTELPWVDVASALRDEAVLTTHKNKALKSQLEEYQDLVVVMTTWVTKHVPIQKSIEASAYSWRNATLFANKESRKLGLDWITKHLYHNTERMLSLCGFQSLGGTDRFDDFAIDMSDPEYFEYTWRHQAKHNAPFETTVAAFRAFVTHFVNGGVWSTGTGTPLDPDIVDQVAAHISYTRIASSPRESINFVSREFATSNQCIFVCQNIPFDETQPLNDEQCNRRLWIVLDRISEHATHIRVVYINSHGFDQHGHFDMAREAAYWGCDLSSMPAEPNAWFEAFQARVHKVGQSFIAHNTSQMDRIFQQQRHHHRLPSSSSSS